MMNLTRWLMLVMAILLVLPSTAVWADTCDELLIRRAGFMSSKRAQIAATVLVTNKNFERLRYLEVANRKLSSFPSYEAFYQWRNRAVEASSYGFEYLGEELAQESARAAILAGTSEDTFSLQWAKCQFEEARKRPAPSLSAWLDRLDDSTAIVRLVLSRVPAPDIELSPNVANRMPEEFDRSRSRDLSGDFTIIVKRLPEQDVYLTAKSSNITVGVVVPSLLGTVSPRLGGQKDNSPAERLQSCASREVGTKEDFAGDNRGERIDIYNREAGAPIGSPWTFSFISYCIKKAGLDRQLPASAFGPQLWANAVKAGLVISAVEFQRTGVKVGDIFFSGSEKSVGPAGIVVRVLADGTFEGIEGNVKNEKDEEGVFLRRRHRDNIKVGIVRFPPSF